MLRYVRRQSIFLLPARSADPVGLVPGSIFLSVPRSGQGRPAIRKAGAIALSRAKLSNAFRFRLSTFGFRRQFR